jgi:hypothetical protein
MSIYLRIRQANSRSGENVEELLEVLDNGAVPRSVRIAGGEPPVSNSIAITSHGSSAFSDYAYNSGASATLRTDLPHPATDDTFWAARGCTCETIAKGVFEKAFQRARPDL